MKQNNKKLIIESGDRFGNLTIIREIDRENKKLIRRRFICKCDCGVIKEIDLRHIISANTKTCGCKIGRIPPRKNKNWKGGRRIESSGYIEVYHPEHPFARANGYIKEHRLIMEKFLNRTLTNNENVHHINGIKSDNRIENLELWTKSQPCGIRVSDSINWSIEILLLYSDKLELRHIESLRRIMEKNKNATYNN